MTDTSLYLGVEIGGTKQQLCVGTAEGRILSRRSVKLGEVTAAEILAWLEENIRQLMEEYAFSGAGVGFGGPLELATGRVLSSLQVPGWKDFALAEWFRELLPCPVTVANDTFTGGVGELMAGAGKGSDLLFYTNIGTGIGGGLYIGGKGFDGSGFGAAYLGNTLVPDWRGKKPGAYTRMELLVSGRSIARRLQEAGYVPESSLLYQNCDSDISTLTALELGQAVREGDAFAVAELDRIVESFSIALANTLATTGATRVVIGGGVAKMGDILFDRIRAKTAELAFIANQGRYEILPCALEDDAVLVGALLLAANPGNIFL
jgi:glucokinase